jgi:hypothetical protein
MANLEVIALNPATPQLRAPGAGDGYLFPRQAIFNGNVGIGTASPGVLLQVGTMCVWQGGDGTSVANGQDSVFIGRLAGNANNAPSAANGIYNTFIGSLAGSANTSGYATTNIGYAAGTANTIGIVNTNVGYQAGFGNVTGNFNVNIGADAGSSNTVDSNIFIGYHAGMNVTPILTGVQNIFVGNEAAMAATSAHNNIGFGYRSGYSITTGYENVFNGSLAGFSVNSGYQNVVIGKEAGKTFTTGTNNVFVGYRAGFSAQTAIYNNTGVGNLSLFGVTSGVQNTALGSNSGQKITTGTLNTFIGNAAGNGAGQKADASNSMALGNGANTTADNQVVIGNTSVTQTLLNGSVGIGTTAPTAVLHIKAGTATASTAPLKFTSGALLTTPETGAVEYLVDDYYATIATGAARKTIAWIPTQINQTASRALNTTYTNTGSRSLMVHATVRCAISLASGNAYVQAKSDSSTPPTTVASGIVGIQNGLLNEDNTFQIFFVVAPGMKYRIDTSTANGTCTLGEFFEVAN